MDTSDDFLGGGDVDLPTKTAEPIKRTAEALPQGTEASNKNKRLSASMLTSGFAKPQLGVPGLKATNKANILGLTI